MIHIFAIVSALDFQHFKKNLFIYLLYCATPHGLQDLSSPFRGLNLGPSTVKGQSRNH